MFARGLGCRLPVNFELLDRCLLMMYLFIYFVQNSYYIDLILLSATISDTAAGANANADAGDLA